MIKKTKVKVLRITSKPFFLSIKDNKMNSSENSVFNRVLRNGIWPTTNIFCFQRYYLYLQCKYVTICQFDFR